MELFLGWVLFSIAVGIAANSRSRSFFGWTLISLFLSPLIGLILVLVFPNQRKDPNAPTSETHVRCPDSKELVLREARKCKHCGCALVPQ